jgi:chromosomal replication initiation ATPase DnaA
METIDRTQKECTASTERTCMRIIQAVEDVTGVPYAAMCMRSRKREICVARQIAWFIIDEEVGKFVSLKTMGRMFGGAYDHTTVLHSIGNIDGLVKFDKHTRKIVKDCVIRFNRIEEKDIDILPDTESALSLAANMEFYTTNVRAIRAAALL